MYCNLTWEGRRKLKDKVVDVLKGIFAALLIPLVFSITFSFSSEMETLKHRYFAIFFNGVATYLIMYLFVFDFQGVYRYGQKLVTEIFKFLDPLVGVASYFLPIYSLLLLILYYIAGFFLKEKSFGPMFVFFVGFTFAMHMILTAKDLKEEDSNPVKTNYFFFMSIIYIANMFLLALMCTLVMPKFTFAAFFNDLTIKAANIYGRAFGQLF